MTVLMRSPAGAQAQVSSTEAEDLKKLGWKERSYDEYKKPVGKTEDGGTLQAVAPHETAAPHETVSPQAAPKRRPGRPPKHPVAESSDHGNGANTD